MHFFPFSQRRLDTRHVTIFSLNMLMVQLMVASHADVLRLVTRSSPWTSAQRTGHFRSLAVSLCFERTNVLLQYLHVDTSVVCHVLMHCLGSFVLQDISSREAKYGKYEILHDMLLTCILYCFAGPGCLIRTICKESRLLLITDIIFIFVRCFFGDAVALLRESYTFL